MALAPPIIQDELLTYQQGDSTAQMAVGSAGWYAWLESASAFSFRSGEGHFTARKERAGNRRGEAYWRAYRKRCGKLHRVYLGKSRELTVERLRAVAVMLASQDAGGGSHNGQEQTADSSASPDASAHQPHLPHSQATRTKSIKARSLFSDLPAPLTALIGREQEQAAVLRLLWRPEVRLVTLSGTGGVGKTRLSLEVATELREEFADGVHFVSLAPISDPDLVMPTIARALDIKESGAQPLLARLKVALHNQQLLLVLDNFEQILPGAPQLTNLLASCPGLKLLVTSRSRLHVQGEHEFSVPPLAVPELKQPLSEEALAQYAAIALFLQRTQAVRPDFQLTHANARAIAEICVQLDGLPLAIELAAARIKLLPPQALLRRLSHRFEVLTGGAQDLPARQQTLRNTIQWSYDLLTEQEQRLFRWLSIFVGGCTLEAAEAVYYAGSGQAIDLLDAMASLVDKHLVQQTEQDGQEPRFLLLETIREFGLECLQESVELEAARRAHARCYLELAERAEPELRSLKLAMWLERLEQEHGNLRAALEWGLEELEGAMEQMAERREVALSLCAALEALWWMHGHYLEARTFLERALARSEGESAFLRARVLLVATFIAFGQGDLDRAEVLGQQSLDLCRALGEARGIARGLLLLGLIVWARGKAAEAISLSEERLSLMRQIGQPGEVADALFHLADQLSSHGEYTKGQILFEEALELFHKAGNELWVGATLVQSAFWLWFSLGDAATIRRRLHEGQTLIKKVGNLGWIAICSCLAALVALREGETTRAVSLIQEGLAMFREMDSRWLLAFTLHFLGRIEAQQGEVTAARSSYEESLSLCREQGEKWITPFNLEGLASLAAAQGTLRWAVLLWGAAEALREATGLPLPPADRAGYEQAVRRVRAHLGAPAFAEAWQEGRTMTPAQALGAQGPATGPLPTQARLRSTPPTKTSATYPARLTAREVEVLRLVAQGMTDAQVAEQLVISPRTVNWHLTSIYGKLQVSTRNAATRYAIEHHLA